MPAAANLLKVYRRISPITGETKQMALNLVSATEVSSPNVPDINVGRLAPNAPTTPSTTQIRARRDQRASVTQRFTSAGLSPTSGISKAGKKGYGKFGEKLGHALVNKNPFGINPADTAASLHGFKEGGFITKK